MAPPSASLRNFCLGGSSMLGGSSIRSETVVLVILSDQEHATRTPIQEKLYELQHDLCRHAHSLARV